MTRTERSSFPRAMIKDRSESRSGLDKSIRKKGAGQHNWGSLAEELNLESAALEDEELEFDEDDITNSSDSVHSDQLDLKKPILGSASLMTEEEIEAAKQLRKHAFKGEGVDLTTIARTSAAVSTSPPKTHPIAVATFEDSPV